jgi:hypothetical protein
MKIGHPAMKIACFDRGIGELLQTNYYHIPRFQRPYSWERDNVEDFWSDAIVGSPGDYFIGSIVVYRITQNDRGVVDGQQRLTTVMLILATLRNAYRDLNHGDLEQGVQKWIERVNVENKSLFVIQTESSYPFLHDHILSATPPDTEPVIGPEEIRIKTAFDIINAKLTEMRLAASNGLTGENASKAQVKALSAVRDKVMALKLIFIELDNEDDAYLIFETLNTRGKDLKTGDLVKNHITKYLRGKNANLDSVKDKWNKLVETLEESEEDLDLDEFLHHYWLSVADYLAAKNLFKTIRKTITAAKCKEFLDALVRDSVYYRSLFEPSSKKWSKNEFTLRNSLMALSQFKVSQHAPFVLALLREYARKRAGLAEVRNALRMLESFHFVFTAITAQRSGGSLAKWYSVAGRDYSRATDATARQKVIADLRKRLKSVLPSEAEFEIRFLSLMFLDDVTKQKKLVQYVLGSFSTYYSHGVAIDGDQMTIEHVAAQNAATGASTINKNKVGNIGNLLYVSSALNDKLGNRPFADKLKVLVASKVPMDPFIANPARDSWTEADVDARAKELSKLAYKTIWKI